MSTMINKITNLKSSVSSANNHLNQSKNKITQSKSMSNLHNNSCSTLNKNHYNSNNNATGSENFFLSSGVHEIGILRRALVAAREGDLQTLQLLQPILSHSGNIVDNFGANLVHYASRSGSIKVLRFLVIKCKLSANCPSNTGSKPIHDAAALVWLIRNAQCSLMDRDREGSTVLHIAARYGRQNIVRWLVKEAKMPVTDKTNSGAIPLHYSAAKGCLDCVKLLVESSSEPSVNTQMENNVTPIYLAAQEGHVNVLRYLVQVAKGDIDLRAKDGMAAIHAASQMGSLKCVKFLVNEQAAQLNCLDNEKASPLHFAASRGRLQVVKWLLKRGARITLDKYGKSPLNDAAENEHMSVLALLLNHAQEHTYQTDCNFVNPTYQGSSNFMCLPFYKKALKNGSNSSTNINHNSSSNYSSTSSCSRSCCSSSRKSSSSQSDYSCSDQCLNWSSDECNTPNINSKINQLKEKKDECNVSKSTLFNKNCSRFNQQWIKSKYDNKLVKDNLKVDENQEEITMINTIKQSNSESSFKKNNFGTVKSITECINNGQSVKDLTIVDQTDDSGKETASESSEPIIEHNLNKSSIDLNSSQSSNYSTENELDFTISNSNKKDYRYSIQDKSINGNKSCLKNGHIKKEFCSHKPDIKTDLSFHSHHHHHTCSLGEQKIDKSTNNVTSFPKTNLDKLDRTNNRSLNCDNYLPDNNETSLNELKLSSSKKYNTLDKASRSIDLNKTDRFINNNTLNKSIRIFESASTSSSTTITSNKLAEKKINKFKKNNLNSDKIDELDENKLLNDTTKDIQMQNDILTKEGSVKETIKELTIKKEVLIEESVIDLKIANNNELDEEAKESIKEENLDTDLSNNNLINDTNSNQNSSNTALSKDNMEIPPPPPMPPQQPSINETITTNSILIKSNKVEKKTTTIPNKITFIPPQFNSPPETDTNIKPSEYLKKVAKSFTVDNFKNMKKIKLAQQKFTKANDESDKIKRSSSENHLLVNLRKDNLNQSASSNNLHNDLREEESLDNDLESELNELQDDTEDDELVEHQYETSKPSAVELKLQIDKTLIKSNLSRRSSMKVKLSAGIEPNLINDENDDCSKDEEIVTKKISQQSLSSSSSGISSSSSTVSSSSSSFSVTEEQLKTIFLKKTPIKKPETKTFNSNVSLQKNDVIAELKQSIDLDGIKKMKEQSNFRNQLNSKICELNSEFTLDKFLAKINEDQATSCFPQWKRLMLAKKALEKARKEAENNLIKEEERLRLKNIPEWKLSLLESKNLNKKEDSSFKMYLKNPKYNSVNNISQSDMNKQKVFKSLSRSSIETPVSKHGNAKIRILNNNQSTYRQKANLSTKLNLNSFELRKTNSIYW